MVDLICGQVNGEVRGRFQGVGIGIVCDNIRGGSEEVRRVEPAHGDHQVNTQKTGGSGRDRSHHVGELFNI